MIRFTATRLVEIAAMLALMSFAIYGLIGLMPGDPIDLMRSADPRATAADVARLKAIYGLDRPLVERYLAWALALGIAAARRPDSPLDSAVNLLSFAGISVPSFWLALILMLVFAVELGWLPASGSSAAGGSDRFRHLILPVATLA